MPLTLELLKERIMPHEAHHEVTPLGFQVLFVSSQLDCTVNPDGSVDFCYHWNNKIYYRGHATDETLEAELAKCQEAMELLDRENRPPQETCDCCGEKYSENLFVMCCICNTIKCSTYCSLEGEGVCKRCFFSQGNPNFNPEYMSNDGCENCQMNAMAAELYEEY